jgi:hypothetical protein
MATDHRVKRQCLSARAPVSERSARSPSSAARFLVQDAACGTGAQRRLVLDETKHGAMLCPGWGISITPCQANKGHPMSARKPRFFRLDRVGLISARMQNDPLRGWLTRFLPHRYPPVRPSDRCKTLQPSAGDGVPPWLRVVGTSIPIGDPTTRDRPPASAEYAATMCGQFTQHYTWAKVYAFLDVFGTPRNLLPRYNIAPTTTVDVVRLDTQGQREPVAMRWGLVPFFWKETLEEVPATFNARAETVAAPRCSATPSKSAAASSPPPAFSSGPVRRPTATRTCSPRPTAPRGWPSQACGISRVLAARSARHPSPDGICLCCVGDAPGRVGRQCRAHARLDPFGSLGAQGGERHLWTSGAAGRGPE